MLSLIRVSPPHNTPDYVHVIQGFLRFEFYWKLGVVGDYGVEIGFDPLDPFHAG